MESGIFKIKNIGPQHRCHIDSSECVKIHCYNIILVSMLKSIPDSGELTMVLQ